MSILLIKSDISQKTSYAIVLTRPCRYLSRPNSLTEIPKVEVLGIKNVTLWLIARHSDHSINDEIYGNKQRKSDETGGEQERERWD